MIEVIVSSQDKSYCQDTARRQIDEVIDGASWPESSSVLPMNSDNIIVLTRVIDMQLLGRGVQLQNLAGTVVTYVPAASWEGADEDCTALQLVLRRAVDGWRLVSVEQVYRPGGIPRQCEIALSPKGRADTLRGRAAV